MTHGHDDTDRLLDRIAQGHKSAADELLERHRGRLGAMVRLRMDRRLTARFDPSDVVQDAMTEAFRKLPQYVQCRPMAFYPWLRSIAWERLIQLYRQHVQAARRSVSREEPVGYLSEGSAAILAERFAKPASYASGHAVGKEVRDRVREALQQLSAGAREIVILRHVEELPFKEITAVLGDSEAAIYSRYRRAIEHLARLLGAKAP